MAFGASSIDTKEGNEGLNLARSFQSRFTDKSCEKFHTLYGIVAIERMLASQIVHSMKEVANRSHLLSRALVSLVLMSVQATRHVLGV